MIAAATVPPQKATSLAAIAAEAALVQVAPPPLAAPPELPPWGGASLLSRHSVINATITFPLVLWGDAGFEFGLENCQHTKDAAKELMAALDGWAATTDFEAKRVLALAKSTAFPAHVYV